MIDNLRAKYAELSEREQRLVMIMVGIFVFLIVIVPLFLITNAINNIEEENTAIVEVMQKIRSSEDTLAQKKLERDAALKRYQTPPPPLGGFLSDKAKKQELDLKQVTDEPEKIVGNFRRKHVRAQFPNISLRAGLKMIDDIAKSPYPVGLERIQVEHFRPGQDQYNLQVGVIAFEKEKVKKDDKK